jgi:hypothetical protein
MRSTSSDLRAWQLLKKPKTIDKAFKPRYNYRMAKDDVQIQVGTAQSAGVCRRDCTPAGHRSFLMTAAYELDAKGRNQ